MFKDSQILWTLSQRIPHEQQTDLPVDYHYRTTGLYAGKK